MPLDDVKALGALAAAALGLVLLVVVILGGGHSGLAASAEECDSPPSTTTTTAAVAATDTTEADTTEPPAAAEDALPSLGDGSPAILGPAELTAGQIETWWSTSSYANVTIVGTDASSITQVIRAYLEEGATEGVRGDWAFAQAVLETGGFTNSDSRLRNNFAGIGHYDDAEAGFGFESVTEGVRAHIQLLKKFAAGNDTELANPDIAPKAGATATTWAALGGTWATDPAYWTTLASVFEAMGGTVTGADCIGTGGAGITIDTHTGPIELVDVPGLGPINAIAASQARSLLAAAAADGLTLTGHSYRDGAQQIELRKAHCGTSYYAIYEMPASSCSPPTARPGTSQHELGLAIDFRNCSTRSTACYRWLAANASSYGFYNLPSEAWHWSTTGY